MATKSPAINLDEFKTAQSDAEKGGKLTCSIGTSLRAMSVTDREAFQAALVDHSIYGTVIAKVLGKHGVRVSGTTVQRHRRGACSCD